ncbi:MAG: uridine kinase [Clostridiales bacterium]|nr:uridine kinase [Clostridiales bacterium]
MHEVFERIDSLIQSKDLVMVAIDGNSGAGKSNLASIIEKEYECNVFHMDDYFLRPEQRTIYRLREVGGNIDYERFKQEVIDGILSRKRFSYSKYDCKTKTLDVSIAVEPKKLNIIEGVYSLHPTLSEFYDLKIFLTIDKKEQIRRLSNREDPSKLKRFIEEWIPLEDEYFKELEIKKKCDLVLDGTLHPQPSSNK